MSDVDDRISRAARLLLQVFRLGVAAALVELVLLRHYEHPGQWVPLVVLGWALLVSWLHGIVPPRAGARLFEATIVLLALGGVLGLVLHFQNNVAFLREMQPHIAGWSLFWGAVRGAVPALAPGTLVYLGLLGLVYSRLTR